VLGVEGFGRYGFAVAIMGFCTVLADFGLNQLQVRETSISKDNDSPRYHIVSSLVARIMLGFIGFAVMAAFAFFSKKPTNLKILLILFGGGVFFYNLMGSFSSVLVGLERFLSYGILSIIHNLGYISLATAGLFLGFGLVGIGVGHFAAALIILIIASYFVSTKVIRPMGKPDIEKAFGIFKRAVPLGITAVLVNIYYKADFVMLSFMKGDQEVGFYNSAYMIVNTLLLLITTFTATLLPRLSSLFATDFEALGRLYRTIFKYLLFAGLGCAFGAVALAGPIFLFLFDKAYLPGAAALSILVWASALMFVNAFQGTALIALDRKRQLAYMTGTAALVNIVLNLLLIPKFGFRGAAVATVISEVIAGAWSFILLTGLNPWRNILPQFAKSLAAALVMFLALHYISGIHVILRIAIGIFMYALVLIVIRGFDKNDWQLIKSVLKLKELP
jgi:O-antigen/teichoic acid export membrane protein